MLSTRGLDWRSSHELGKLRRHPTGPLLLRQWAFSVNDCTCICLHTWVTSHACFPLLPHVPCATATYLCLVMVHAPKNLHTYVAHFVSHSPVQMCMPSSSCFTSSGTSAVADPEYQVSADAFAGRASHANMFIQIIAIACYVLDHIYEPQKPCQAPAPTPPPHTTVGLSAHMIPDTYLRTPNQTHTDSTCHGLIHGDNTTPPRVCANAITCAMT
jgi:hypothetical protein